MLLLAAGCTAGPNGIAPSDSTTNSFGPYDDAALEDRAERGPGAPCAGGTWGHIDLPEQAIHVRANGSDVTGDGTLASPYRTLDRALIHVAGGGRNNLRIALGPGQYSTDVTIEPSAAFPWHQWLTIEGCGITETRLVASDPLRSVVRVRESRGIAIQGMSVEGGRRAVRVDSGGMLRLYDATVEESNLVGVLVHDSASEIVLRDTEVRGTVPVGDMGWGVAVLDGTMRMTRGGAYDNTELGLFADAATLTLTDAEVFDTVPSGRFNSLGRGIHLQNGTDLTMTGGYVRNNADAGMFLLDPGTVVIDGLVIDIISAGIVIDFPSTGFSGDGIVVSGGQDIEIYDSLVSGSARTALLLDGAAAVLTGNQTWDNGMSIGGLDMFTQSGGTASGADANDVVDLGGPLLINDWALPTELLVEGP